MSFLLNFGPVNLWYRSPAMTAAYSALVGGSAVLGALMVGVREPLLLVGAGAVGAMSLSLSHWTDSVSFVPVPITRHLTVGGINASFAYWMTGSGLFALAAGGNTLAASVAVDVQQSSLLTNTIQSMLKGLTGVKLLP